MISSVIWSAEFLPSCIISFTFECGPFRVAHLMLPGRFDRILFRHKLRKSGPFRKLGLVDVGFNCLCMSAVAEKPSPRGS